MSRCPSRAMFLLVLRLRPLWVLDPSWPGCPFFLFSLTAARDLCSVVVRRLHNCPPLGPRGYTSALGLPALYCLLLSCPRTYTFTLLHSAVAATYNLSHLLFYILFFTVFSTFAFTRTSVLFIPLFSRPSSHLQIKISSKKYSGETQSNKNRLYDGIYDGKTFCSQGCFK